MKTTRRAVIKATALGLAGAASPLTASALVTDTEQTAPQRSIIDFHAHWIAPKVVELLGARTSPRPPQGQGWFDVDARLKQMDQAGVQRQVLSYVGAAYDGVMKPEEARPFWRAQNDDLGAAGQETPGAVLGTGDTADGERGVGSRRTRARASRPGI